jgi:DNA mismatch repair protein MutS
VHKIFRRFKTTSYKHIITFFVIGGLLGQNLALVAEEVPLTPQKGVSFATLADFFTSPLKPSENETNLPLKTAPKEQLDPLAKKISGEFATLSDYEKKKIAFAILSHNKETILTDETVVSLIRELEIFTNRNNPGTKSVFSTLNRTSTTFGEIHLAHMLANPTDDVTVLTKRQALIRELVKNDDLFNSLDLLLTKIKKTENGFLALTKHDELLDEHLNDSFYFPSWLAKEKQLNTSPLALQTAKMVGDLWAPALATVNILVSEILEKRRNEALILLGSSHQPPSRRQTSSSWREYNPFNYPSINNEIREGLLRQNRNMSYQEAYRQAFNNTLALGNQAFANIIKYGLESYLFYAKSRSRQASMRYIHQKMVDTSTLINASKELSTKIALNDTLTKNFKAHDAFARIFNRTNNPDINKLVELFQTNTLKSGPSYFSYAGRTLASHKLTKNNITTLLPIMEAVGEIDAYMSIAKLYKESQRDKVGHCFATYKQTDPTPSLSLKGFWHPLIAKETAVTNDLIFDKSTGNSGIILTGSNTGGKSTILKSALLSVLLAQTITIAPAEAVNITPFALLGSYLSVSDDIAAGNSLFKAEVLRAKSLLQNIKALQPGKGAFVIIDELFTGTAADKGSAAAKKVADALACKQNLLYILATHFPELTKLEGSTNGRCKNYLIDVIRNRNGSITRPFKMKPGVSKTNIADDLLQEELVDLTF